MPSKPSRPCRKAGCNKLTTAKDGYCEKHTGLDKRKADEQRGTATERGYDGKWNKIRKQVMQHYSNLCVRCKQNNRIKPATVVHHLDENPYNNNFDNLMPLCYNCHKEIHRK